MWAASAADQRAGREVAELEQPDVAGDADELVDPRRRADDERPSVALGDRLGAAGRQHAVSDRDDGEHRLRVGVAPGRAESTRAATVRERAGAGQPGGTTTEV